jgi:hypothetical protein
MMAHNPATVIPGRTESANPESRADTPNLQLWIPDRRLASSAMTVDKSGLTP